MKILSSALLPDTTSYCTSGPTLLTLAEMRTGESVYFANSTMLQRIYRTWEKQDIRLNHFIRHVTTHMKRIASVQDKFRLDSTKIQFHPRRVTALIDGRDDWERAKEIYPLYVEVSPVGACNHRCKFCSVDFIGYKPVRLDSARFHNLMCEFYLCGVKSVMFAGEGEPLLHTEINRMVDSARFNTIDVSFTTNGTLLHKLRDLDRISWIKVSMNAGTAKTYAAVHRTKENDFYAVWRNIEYAVKRKGKCTIGVQMVVLPENEHEVHHLKKLCLDAGVDYCVLKPYSQHKSSLTHEYENFKPVDVIERTGIIVREEAFKTTEIPYEKCNATPFLWAYLMANGDLYSCSAYLLDDRFNLGNVNTESFKAIWHGEKRRANWEYVRKHLDIHDCRVNCRMNQANVYLNQLDNGVPHENFI
jgi:radical SAM protein with 4Fe4S-binding SPASM domain